MSSISDHVEEDHLGEDPKDEGMGHVLRIFAAIGIVVAVIAIGIMSAIIILF